MEFTEITGLMEFPEPLTVPYGIADACMLYCGCIAPTGRGCLTLVRVVYMPPPLPALFRRIFMPYEELNRG